MWLLPQAWLKTMAAARGQAVIDYVPGKRKDGYFTSIYFLKRPTCSRYKT